MHGQWRRPGAEFGGRKIFRGPRLFLNDFFRKEFPFSRPKFSMTFFSHRPGFSDFPYLYCVKCRIYDPFFTRKSTISEKNSVMTPFFTLFVLSRASDNTNSRNIGGNGCMGRPPTSIFGGHRPVGLRL